MQICIGKKVFNMLHNEFKVVDYLGNERHFYNGLDAVLFYDYLIKMFGENEAEIYITDEETGKTWEKITGGLNAYTSVQYYLEHFTCVKYDEAVSDEAVNDEDKCYMMRTYDKYGNLQDVLYFDNMEEMSVYYYSLFDRNKLSLNPTCYELVGDNYVMLTGGLKDYIDKELYNELTTKHASYFHTNIKLIGNVCVFNRDNEIIKALYGVYVKVNNSELIVKEIKEGGIKYEKSYPLKEMNMSFNSKEIKCITETGVNIRIFAR